MLSTEKRIQFCLLLRAVQRLDVFLALAFGHHWIADKMSEVLGKDLNIRFGFIKWEAVERLA